jgi:hypothetical protein
MIELMLAAALMQAPGQTGDPCHAVGAVVGAQVPGCPAWRLLLVDGDTLSFVDPASVRRSGDTFEILNRGVFAAPRNGARSVIVTWRFDCRARTVRTVTGVFYDARGARLRDFTPTGAQAEPQTIPPGAPFDRIRTELCPR